MAWKETSDGWVQDPNGTHHMGVTAPETFSPGAMVYALYKACLSVANIARRLSMSHAEVKEIIESYKNQNQE